MRAAAAKESYRRTRDARIGREAQEPGPWPLRSTEQPVAACATTTPRDRRALRLSKKGTRHDKHQQETAATTGLRTFSKRCTSNWTSPSVGVRASLYAAVRPARPLPITATLTVLTGLVDIGSNGARDRKRSIGTTVVVVGAREPSSTVLNESVNQIDGWVHA